MRDLEREQRALAVLDTLRNLGEFLSGVRGRRKAVLLFSEGLEMPMSEIYSLHTPTDVGGAIGMPSPLPHDRTSTSSPSIPAA